MRSGHTFDSGAHRGGACALRPARWACVRLWHAGPARRPRRNRPRPAKCSPTHLRSSCCSRPTAHGSTCSARKATKCACSMRQTYASIKNIPVGHVPRGFSLSPDGSAPLCHQHLGRHALGDRHARARSGRHVAGRRRALQRGRGSRRQAPVCRQSHLQRRRRARCADRRGREAAGGGARRQLHHCQPRWQPGSTPRMSIPIPRSSRRRAAIAFLPSRRSRSSTRRARWLSIAFRCIASRILSTPHFPPTGASASRPNLHPKNLVPLAHLEHGGAFADTLTLFGADVGKPVELPLDELERYAVRPFGVAISPDKSRIYVTCDGSEIVTVIDVPRAARVSFARTPARFRPGSFGERATM